MQTWFYLMLLVTMLLLPAILMAQSTPGPVNILASTNGVHDETSTGYRVTISKKASVIHLGLPMIPPMMLSVTRIRFTTTLMLILVTATLCSSSLAAPTPNREFSIINFHGSLPNLRFGTLGTE